MFADNRISHIVEPKCLCLAWNGPGVSRYVVGELVLGEDNNVTLNYCPKTKDFKNAKKKGFVPIPAFQDANQRYSTNVMDFFMSRITSRERGDFDLYLQTLGIAPERKGQISDFALLGYGEGRLPSDGYHVVNPYTEIEPPVEFVTEIAGLTLGAFTKMMDDVTPGQEISLLCEPGNQHDKNAVRIDLNGENLGYINRIQALSVTRWINNGHEVKGVIFRKNGLPSAPRVFAFLEVAKVEPSSCV